MLCIVGNILHASPSEGPHYAFLSLVYLLPLWRCSAPPGEFSDCSNNYYKFTKNETTHLVIAPNILKPFFFFFNFFLPEVLSLWVKEEQSKGSFIHHPRRLHLAEALLVLLPNPRVIKTRASAKTHTHSCPESESWLVSGVGNSTHMQHHPVWYDT